MPDKIHIAVGFYPNGDYKINHVRTEDLENNIDYNRTYRPGRFYFVDGEYVCGGMFDQPHQNEFITQCKQRLTEIDLSKPTHDSCYV